MPLDVSLNEGANFKGVIITSKQKGAVTTRITVQMTSRYENETTRFLETLTYTHSNLYKKKKKIDVLRKWFCPDINAYIIIIIITGWFGTHWSCHQKVIYMYVYRNNNV